MRFNRVFVIVLDSLGIGPMADSARFDDAGADTLGHISETVEHLDIPNLQRLGLANLKPLKQVKPTEHPEGYFMAMNEASNGKDTMTGHWEMMGIRTDKPFITFTEHGFPKELIDELEKRCGRKIIGNKAASGTEILEELGEQEVNEGKLIVYTSADSVFQVAAHEDIVPVEKLYEYCQIARDMLRGEHGVGRVIARPFTGTPGNFTRTTRRHDFSLQPPKVTMLDQLSGAGFDVLSVGKIIDIFAEKGITEYVRTTGNEDGINKTLDYMKKDFNGLCFTNLVDYDMLYGHRNDVEGYAKALTYFDERLPELLAAMGEEDVLMITADHGCDPSTPSTDHSREYTPLVMYGAPVRAGENFGTRKSFSDIAATILSYFDLTPECAGEAIPVFKK